MWNGFERVWLERRKRKGYFEITIKLNLILSYKTFVTFFSVFFFFRKNERFSVKCWWMGVERWIGGRWTRKREKMYNAPTRNFILLRKWRVSSVQDLISRTKVLYFIQYSVPPLCFCCCCFSCFLRQKNFFLISPELSGGKQAKENTNKSPQIQRTLGGCHRISGEDVVNVFRFRGEWNRKRTKVCDSTHKHDKKNDIATPKQTQWEFNKGQV